MSRCESVSNVKVPSQPTITMRNQLPLELLIQIAGYLEAENVSLRQYALVCRAWQVAFESFIYKFVTMHSDKVSELESIISNEDKAFQIGIVKLMDYLKCWGELLRLHLVLAISGREQALELGTERDEELREFAGRRNGDLTPRPYRARFLNNGNHLELPTLSSVHQLNFDNRYDIFNPVHRIWPAAALHIASCCPNLHSLFLDIEEYVRPDHVDYMQKGRKALGEGLSSLPASLRVFRVKNRHDDVWHGGQPGSDLFAGAQDIFSHNLRDLSMRLQELDISRTQAALELFCPLNTHKISSIQPIGNWASLTAGTHP
ncbi:F-box protein [Aspergillus stella-maris]|uniref:F-box protein n=1 Tax=Aspergillus stella-maris TaxID=1810926 RepID=UPI003CCDBFEB